MNSKPSSSERLLFLALFCSTSAIATSMAYDMVGKRAPQIALWSSVGVGIAGWLIQQGIWTQSEALALYAEQHRDIPIQLAASASMGAMAFWMVHSALDPGSPLLHRTAWAGALAGMAIWFGYVEQCWTGSDIYRRLPPDSSPMLRPGFEKKTRQELFELFSTEEGAMQGVAPLPPHLDHGPDSCWFAAMIYALKPCLLIEEFQTEIQKENQGDFWDPFREIFRQINAGERRVSWATLRPAYEQIAEAIALPFGTQGDPDEGLSPLFERLPENVRSKVGLHYRANCKWDKPFKDDNTSKDEVGGATYASLAKAKEHLKNPDPVLLGRLGIKVDYTVRTIQPGQDASIQVGMNRVLNSGPKNVYRFYAEKEQAVYAVKVSVEKEADPPDILPILLGNLQGVHEAVYWGKNRKTDSDDTKSSAQSSKSDNSTSIDFEAAPIQVNSTIEFGGKTYDLHAVTHRYGNHHTARLYSGLGAVEADDIAGVRWVDGLNAASGRVLIYLRRDKVEYPEIDERVIHQIQT